MRITVFYDNTAYRQDLMADCGFSCLEEIPRGGATKILFDTGARDSIVLSNMDNLNIDPRSIDQVFIPHAHFDHVARLSAFLNINSEVTMYVPRSISGVHGVNRVVSVSDAFVKSRFCSIREHFGRT
jgi:7,8-dihydropterin-6-yl-methyl-4-(beta-D-ribofuranosyl)aminobenzene 5'-phosphate synthase